MRHNLFNSISAVIFALGLSHSAWAGILVNPPDPYPQAKMGDTGLNVFYAGSGTATVTNVAVNKKRGFRVIDTGQSTLDDNLIWVDITSDAPVASGATTNTVITLSTGSAVGTEVPLIGAGIVSDNIAPPKCAGGGGSCQGTGFKSALYSPGQVIRLSFSLTGLCGTGGTLGTLCTGGNAYTNMTTVTPSTLTQQIYVTIAAADISSGNAIPTTGFSFNLGITNIPPALGCPSSFAEYYFPGDQQIYLKAGGFTSSANNGVALMDFLFMAKPGGVAADTGPNGVGTNPIVSYQSYSNQSEVKGFDNNESYGVITYAENIAGILDNTGCPLLPVKSIAIHGVLAESKCFIATAAFHDGRAAPVMLLRKFRDQVLSKFEFGRKFIETYYTYSPAMAEWAWDKPIIRSIALRALAPAEFFAWAWLKISHAQENPQATGNQPYIDRLKKQLDEEDQKNGNDFPESNVGYTEQMKRKLAPTPAPGNNEEYINRLKKDLPPAENSDGYAEKTKAELPPVTERESPITAVKEKRDHKLGRGDVKPIENAVGFKLGVNPGTEVAASGGHPFEYVYGSDWKPDFIMHFEHQFMHSENFGSFAGSIDLGVNYASGYGIFDTPFNGSDKSITTFTFVQIPLILGGYYRFNLARILRPYVGAGVGTILYTEIRNDDQKDLRGYSFVYTTSIGASLLLDFLDSATSRDSYLSMGIQHTYLFMEYMYLNSFSSPVTFKRAGVYAGFLFEF
jgi:hypothetical protein